MTTDLDRLCVNTLRFLAVDGVERAQSGHPGTPMEAAGLGYVLWTNILKHNPKDPSWPNRDRFILSAGHASMLLYGLLYLTGYDLSLEDLKSFRQWGSRTPGHPEAGHTPGVETTTGPLGQGFATGVGMAIAQRALAARFNRPGCRLVDYHIWAFVSDGDMMEGLSSEAASLAGHLGLASLKYVYLDTRITIEGPTHLAFSENVETRFTAQRWRVLHLPDPEDIAAVGAVFETARQVSDRPTLIIARTHIGFGAPRKQDTAAAHGAPLGAEETAAAKKNLGWPVDPSFHVPEKVQTHMAGVARSGQQHQAAWEKEMAQWRADHPTLAAEWDLLHQSALTGPWREFIPFFKPGEGMATRTASGVVLNALAPVLPGLMGGSADLSPSNNTEIKSGGHFSAATPEGKNLHFGIREHAMGAALNGMALAGPLIPYGGTFLVFCDYMRPAIRLAALSRLGVIYVFTHDSIGVGEDGPTHQPVEQLAALRSIPGLTVIRPADANETAMAWRAAIEKRDGPTALILSRQQLPVLDRQRCASAEGLLRGGYRLTLEDRVDVLLIATGSEVALALSARDTLAGDGISAGVVSLPSWELFEAQDLDYRHQVIPPAVRARVVIEAGVRLGWDRYAGPEGEYVTLDRFGASAPGDVVMEKLGFYAQRVAQAARTSMARAKI